MGRRRARGRGSRATGRRSRWPITASPATGSTRRPAPTARAPEALFCENESNAPRVFGSEATTPYPKDGINDHVVSGAATVNPEGFGTKAALRYRVTVAGGGKAELRLRLHQPATTGARRDLGRRGIRRGRRRPRAGRRRVLRRARAGGTPPEQMPILRQACAGLVWSKQMYPYNVRSLAGRRPGAMRAAEAHRHGRNSDWRHLDSFDVLAMPDPWEYPWFAAWDLGFHCVPWAHLDPAFAKYQLIVLLREWFQHPNGALPAYEWNFDDVNPPVHVMAALRVFLIDGGTDREFLERVFQKLLINFTWWLNREDADGNNVFSGGFLGLDNISPIDRSNLPEGVTLEQADGTAWMAYYALSMLLIALALAEENDVYWDMVIKFLEQFVLVARALERQGLYDADDAFFYDRLVYPSGESTQVKVKTISGLLPVLPAVPLSARVVQAAERLGKRFARLRDAWAETGGTLGVGRVRRGRRRAGGARLGDRPGRAPEDPRGVLRRGRIPLAARAPRRLEALRGEPVHARGRPRGLDRLRAGRVDHVHVRRQLELARPDLDAAQLPRDPPVRHLPAILRRRVQARIPDGLGPGSAPSGEIAQDLADRIISIWLPGPDGRRPLYGGTERLQTDPAWKDNLFFNEYFHGDNGAGLGATHQTGWTALVADLILDPPSAGALLGLGAAESPRRSSGATDHGD